MKHSTLIFIADDDEAMRSMLATSLRKAGFRVNEAEDGRALLDRLVEASEVGEVPDLVISDLQMPRASGFEVLEQLRGRQEKVPVLLITASADSGTTRRAQELGATSVLFKPFDLEVLSTQVAELITTSPTMGSRDTN